jgi:hypothetical protein
MLSRRPWVATEIRTPSEAQKMARRITTPAGDASGTRDTMISTATIAATMIAESSRRWNSAVHISGIRITMPTPLVVPAARIRASTDPVYSSGTSTGAQSGSRDQGRKNAAAVSSSRSTLATTAPPDRGPGGSATLASASTATAANGSTRDQTAGPVNGLPLFSSALPDILASIADPARYPIMRAEATPL